MFQNVDLSDMFVCLTGNALLNYRCFTCRNFKWSDQGDVSCCRASDVTLSNLYEETILMGNFLC